MELEGHPTGDIVDELRKRGANVYPGDHTGPDPASMQIAQRHAEPQQGVWIFLPDAAYDTDIDDIK